MSKILMSNVQMETAVRELSPLLERADMLGYAAARNTRLMRESLTEYIAEHDRLVRKHGMQRDGRYCIEPGGDEEAAFREELAPFAEVEHEIDVFRVPEESAIGVLTGRQFLSLSWMLEDGNGGEETA